MQCMRPASRRLSLWENKAPVAAWIAQSSRDTSRQADVGQTQRQTARSLPAGRAGPSRRPADSSVREVTLKGRVSQQQRTRDTRREEQTQHTHTVVQAVERHDFSHRLVRRRQHCQDVAASVLSRCLRPLRLPARRALAVSTYNRAWTCVPHIASGAVHGAPIKTTPRKKIYISAMIVRISAKLLNFVCEYSFTDHWNNLCDLTDNSSLNIEVHFFKSACSCILKIFTNNKSCKLSVNNLNLSVSKQGVENVLQLQQHTIKICCEMIRLPYQWIPVANHSISSLRQSSARHSAMLVKKSLIAFHHCTP